MLSTLRDFVFLLVNAFYRTTTRKKRKVENLLPIKKSQFSTFSNFVQNLSIRGRSSYLLNQSNER